MTNSCRRPAMRWNEVTGAIARHKRASTQCGRRNTFASVSPWTCSGISRRPIAHRPRRPCIRPVLGRKNSKNDATVSELLGNFYRDGKIDTQETIETNDHDFGSAGAGVVIPHSLYDVGKNKGFIHLNTSHDTSELACDSLAAWWDQQGRADYPQAQKLLVLCDGGGSNSATMDLFKEDLQKLASRLGIEIRVAHYPPYCSKYNPIEHRLFPHLTRACRGVIFHTLETVRYYMAKAETTTGMRVKVSI